MDEAYPPACSSQSRENKEKLRSLGLKLNYVRSKMIPVVLRSKQSKWKVGIKGRVQCKI